MKNTFKHTHTASQPHPILCLTIALGCVLFHSSAVLAQGQGNSTYVTAGSGGVTLNYMVTPDTTAPSTLFIPAPLGQCGVGFALASAPSGNSFPLGSGVGSLQKGVADSAIIAGDLLVPAMTTPGAIYDSGQPQSNWGMLSLSQCVIGVALASAPMGGTFPLIFYGMGNFGTADIVTSEILGGTSPGPLPASVTSLTTTSSINGGADINATGVVNANGAGVPLSGNTYNSGSIAGTITGTTGSCTITYTGGGAVAPNQGTATLNFASGTPQSTLVGMATGSGYTSLPTAASINTMSCSGVTVGPPATIGVTVPYLTPGCVHMQDGLGDDMGICAPSSGANVLWNLPSSAAPGANYVMTVDGSNDLQWSGAPMSLAGAFTTSGAYALTLTTTGSTNVTLPTTGTLAAVLSGTSGSIGGTALSNSCSTDTVTISGVSSSMAVAVSPAGDITTGGTVAFSVFGVPGSGSVTVYVCGTGTPTTTTYNVRVIR